MNEAAGRIAGGLVLLVALWVGVYWWWPSEPPISFAQHDDTIRGVAPKESRQAAVPEPQPEVRPEPVAPKPPPQAVIPPEFTRHTVQPGETLESIAKHYFGSKSKASAIIAANQLTDPTRVAPGRVILIPKDPNNIQGIPVTPAPDLAKTAVPTGGGSEYIVRAGDSLTRISQEVYGDSRLAETIYEANRDQLSSEHAIKPGQKLRIPPRPAR